MPRDLFAEAEVQKPGRDLFKEQGIQMQTGGQGNSDDVSIFGDPKMFAEKMENFYRASGIHGANRGFAKVFGFGPHRENAENNYQEALRTNPKATVTGNVLAQLYSSIPFLMGGAQAARAIPGIGAAAQNIAGSALGAGAMGAFSHPEEGETRGGNALKDVLIAGTIPLAGKAIGFGAKAAGNSIGKIAPNLGKSITKNRVAESIGNSFKDVKSKYSTLYGDLFKDARNAGVKTNLPKVSKKLTQGIDADTVKSLRKALQTNEPKNVNQAQSKLGEYIRAEQKIKRNGGRIDQLALDNAKKLQKSLNKGLDSAFAKSNPDLAKRFTAIKGGYKNDVVPYSRNRAIQEFSAGELVPEDLVRALRGGSNSGKAFRKHLADKHPEVAINKKLSQLATGIGGATGLYGGYKYFAD